MNIDEKENAEGNKNKPILKNIPSILIIFGKYLTNTYIINYFFNLSSNYFIFDFWLSLFLIFIHLRFYSQENLSLENFLILYIILRNYQN